MAAFSRRVGGGFGARARLRPLGDPAALRACEAEAPISGQRAMRVEVLRATLPFARGYGMEIGMTVDAVRAGYRLREYELDLEHRADRPHPRAASSTAAASCADFARAYLSCGRSQSKGTIANSAISGARRGSSASRPL